MEQRILLAVFLTALLACGNETVTGPVVPAVLRIEPIKAYFVPGDTIRVMLHNVGLKDVSFSTCGSELDRWSGSEWIRYSIGSGGVFCTLSLNVVRPGESLKVAVAFMGATTGVFPPQFSAGTYRVVLAGAAIPGTAVSGNEQLPRESAPFYFAGTLPD